MSALDFSVREKLEAELDALLVPAAPLPWSYNPSPAAIVGLSTADTPEHAEIVGKVAATFNL
jgi:hypothetical protein